MNDAAKPMLNTPVSVKVRVDNSPVAIIKTTKVGRRAAYLPTAELPLTEDSFVELEFFDGVDRLIVPARVTAVGETELKLEYEQTGATFEHWYNAQLARVLSAP